jgi:hypothetical protein
LRNLACEACVYGIEDLKLAMAGFVISHHHLDVAANNSESVLTSDQCGKVQTYSIQRQTDGLHPDILYYGLLD